MDLATIEMPTEEAKALYDDYAAALKRRHDDEDEAIAAGYRALSEGKRLISLSQAIREGGIDADGFPKLAACRAIAEWCWVSRERDGAVNFSMSDNWQVHSRRNSKAVVRLPAGTLPAVDDDRWFSRPVDGDYRAGLASTVNNYRYRAMVPTVPPRLRPTRALTTYHVLWEAEWGKAPQPPGDPALLKHLRGDLWIVVAEWDLTDLERMVLSQRLLRES